MHTLWKYLEKTLGQGLLFHVAGLWGCTAFFIIVIAIDLNFGIPYAFYPALNIFLDVSPWVFWYCGIGAIFISIADILYANDEKVIKKEREQYRNAGYGGLTLTIPLLLLGLFLQMVSSIFYFG